MTTFDGLVNEVLLTLNGYGLVQPRAAFLRSPVTAADLAFEVSDATDFSQGVVEIGDELVFVESVDPESNVLNISPDGRGYNGTTAAAHDVNKRVTNSPTWPRQQVGRAINDTILGLWPDVWGTGTFQFTSNPVVTTYQMPVDIERVLQVTADTIGPSREQQHVRRFSFNPLAPVGEFANGHSLTLLEGVFPGVTVTVTYAKRPTELTTGLELSTAGLSESARRCLVYGACADLLFYMDPARLPVHTAVADEYDNRNQIGDATRIAAQLYARYEVELDKERRRLRVATPATIMKRSR